MTALVIQIPTNLLRYDQVFTGVAPVILLAVQNEAELKRYLKRTVVDLDQFPEFSGTFIPVHLREIGRLCEAG